MTSSLFPPCPRQNSPGGRYVRPSLTISEQPDEEEAVQHETAACHLPVTEYGVIPPGAVPINFSHPQPEQTRPPLRSGWVVSTTPTRTLWTRILLRSGTTPSRWMTPVQVKATALRCHASAMVFRGVPAVLHSGGAQHHQSSPGSPVWPPNMDGAKIPLQSQNIDIAEFERLLGSYYDGPEIIKSLRYGWDLSLDPDPQLMDTERNHSSAEDYPDDVDSYIREELAFRCLVSLRHFRPQIGLSLKQRHAGTSPFSAPMGRRCPGCGQPQCPHPRTNPGVQVRPRPVSRLRLGSRV